MFTDMERAINDSIKKHGMPMFIDLHTDIKEEQPMHDSRWIENTWIRWPAGEVLKNHLKSLKDEPPIAAQVHSIPIHHRSDGGLS